MGKPDHPQEVALMTSLRASLEGMRRKAKEVVDAEATAPPPPPPTSTTKPATPPEESKEVVHHDEEDETGFLREKKKGDVEPSSEADKDKDKDKESSPANDKDHHIMPNGVGVVVVDDPTASEAAEKGKSVSEPAT